MPQEIAAPVTNDNSSSNGTSVCPAPSCTWRGRHERWCRRPDRAFLAQLRPAAAAVLAAAAAFVVMHHDALADLGLAGRHSRSDRRDDAARLVPGDGGRSAPLDARRSPPPGGGSRGSGADRCRTCPTPSSPARPRAGQEWDRETREAPACGLRETRRPSLRTPQSCLLESWLSLAAVCRVGETSASTCRAGPL